MMILNSTAQEFIDETLRNSLFHFEKVLPDDGQFYKFGQLSGFLSNFINNTKVTVEYEHTYSFYDISKSILTIHIDGKCVLSNLSKCELFRVANAICYVASSEQLLNWINKPIDGLKSFREDVQLLVATYTVALICEKFDLHTYQSSVCRSLATLNDGSEMSLIAKMSLNLFDYIDTVASQSNEEI